jgi:pimeloyl-ACP methyl ester carboxylesterase
MKSLILILFTVFSTVANAKPVIVLVPGFFNSLAIGYIKQNPQVTDISHSPYFSKAVTQTLEAHGFDVYVIGNLKPVGSLESNGELTLQFLTLLRQARPQDTIHVIGHSAGGLYTLYALNKRPQLNIKSLNTIATPFAGVDIVDDVARFAPILERVANLINLDSLAQLKKEKVAKFLVNKRVPNGLYMRFFPAKQTLGGLLGWTRAKHFTWPLGLTARIAGTNSDGIVSIPSATGTGIVLTTMNGQRFRLSDFAGPVLPLEHWEQAMDYRVFTTVGVRDPQYVRDRQIEIFSLIAKSLPQ